MERSVESGLAITTTMLADSYVGVPYEAQLETIGASGTVTWSLMPGEELPEGFLLEEDTGRITGVGTSAILGGGESKSFAFMVRAVDSQNRSASLPLSITVRSEMPEAPKVPKAKKGGCQAGGSAPGLLALGAAALLLRRKRQDV